VTYLQTDPFYVLDLNPATAEILGELKITGFSAYLHSINDANTLLVGVGQEADENGNILGLQVSLFDASDPTNPILVHKATVEEEKDTWSSSDVLFDFLAFRYVPLGPEVGIVIIPVRVESWNQGKTGNFDGFYVYDVSPDGIVLRTTISHVESEAFYGCYSSAQLPRRSRAIRYFPPILIPVVRRGCLNWTSPLLMIFSLLASFGNCNNIHNMYYAIALSSIAPT
jgi:hypothetical protein